MGSHRLSRCLGLVVAVVLVTSCAAASGADEGSTDDLGLPPVESEATLTVVGGSGAVYSFSDLESLPMHQIEIEEPFINEQTTFQGPRLSDVLDLAGITEGDVELLAINDYGYTLSVDEWGTDALLATRENGAPIDTEDGGPFRVVAELDTAIGGDRGAWVWSIDRLVVD